MSKLNKLAAALNNSSEAFLEKSERSSLSELPMKKPVKVEVVVGSKTIRANQDLLDRVHAAQWALSMHRNKKLSHLDIYNELLEDFIRKAENELGKEL